MKDNYIGITTTYKNSDCSAAATAEVGKCLERMDSAK